MEQPIFLDYGFNQSHQIVCCSMRRGTHFQFFVAVTPGTKPVLSSAYTPILSLFQIQQPDI
jgi:hypothetical protein